MARQALSALLAEIADNTDQQITPANLRTVVTELYKALDADGSTELPAGYAPTLDGQVVTKKVVDDSYPPITEADFVKNDGSTPLPGTYTPVNAGDVATKKYVDDNIPADLDGLSDVDLTTGPTDAQALRYELASTSWKAGNAIPDMQTVTDTIAEKVAFQGALTVGSPPPGAVVWMSLPAPAPANQGHYWVLLDSNTVPAGIPDIGGQAYDEGAWLYSDGAHFILVSGNAMQYTEAHERFGFMPHDAAKAYKTDQNVSHNNGLYRCKADIAAKAWDPADWTQIINVPQKIVDLTDVDATGIVDGDTLMFNDRDQKWHPERLDHAAHFVKRNPSKAQTIDSTDNACIFEYDKMWVPRTGSITLAVGERIDDPALWISLNPVLFPWSATGAATTDRPWTERDMCAYQNKLYYCLKDTVNGAAWNAADWQPMVLPSNRLASIRVPTTGASPGDLGEVAYDSDTLYLRANSGWKKVALGAI